MKPPIFNPELKPKFSQVSSETRVNELGDKVLALFMQSKHIMHNRQPIIFLLTLCSCIVRHLFGVIDFFKKNSF